MKNSDRLQDSRPKQETIPLVEAALRGTDRIVAAQHVGYHYGHKKPPRRLRIRPEASKPAPQKLTWGKRIGLGFEGFLLWLIDPLHWLGDGWFDGLFRSRKQRIRDKRLKGGWQSPAGRLMSHNFGAGPRLLVRGEQALLLVQIEAHGAEISWSAPLSEFRGFELADWDSADDERATLRCHFEDGSWADVRANGPGWRGFLDSAPPPESRTRS